MSKKPAAIPLFADAYLADTMHLTLEEHGAYLNLLMVAWRTEDCSLPDDDKRLARMLGISKRKWTSIKDVVMDFWTLEDGKYYQKRLSKERNWVNEKSQINSQNRSRKTKQATGNKRNAPNGRSNGPDNETPNETATPPPPPPPKFVDDVDIVDFANRVCRAAGVRHLEPGYIIKNHNQIREWQALGLSQAEIITVISRLVGATSEPINSLKYFDAAMRQHVAKGELPHGTENTSKDRTANAGDEAVREIEELIARSGRQNASGNNPGYPADFGTEPDERRAIGYEPG